MINTTVTNFRNNLYGMVNQTIKYSEPITVSTKAGNAVLINEEEYNAMVETLYLMSIPSMEETLLEGMDEPLDECVDESEVTW